MKTLLWVAAIVFAVDQATKYLVVQWLDLRSIGSLDVFPPLLNLRMAWNTGINFGLFSGSSDAARWILIAIALVIVGVVVAWVLRGGLRWTALVSAGFLVGGALGNVIDRLVYGAVADFLNMSCCGINNPFAFNVADIAIFGGALGLAFFADDTKRPPKEENGS